MNKQQINESLQMINELAGRLSSLMEEQTKVINKLPPQERAKLSVITTEMEAIKKGLKEGDINALELMLKRYADTDSKR
jgi:ethanolamine ammonia-lyase large subunit